MHGPITRGGRAVARRGTGRARPRSPRPTTILTLAILPLFVGPGDGAFQPQRFSNPDVLEGRDLFLAAFDEDGARAWGTYFGGENADTTARVAADPGGVALIGRSKSSGVATNGSVHLDPFNLIVARFDVSGQRVWSAYVGGGEEDAETSITTHTDGSVYIAAFTASTTNIVTPDAAYPEFTDDYYKNGFVAKLDRASGDVVWASYYPNSGTARALHYAASALYLAGETTLETGIATPGTEQEQLAGEADCYLVRLEAPAAPGGGCVVAGDCPSALCVDGVCCDTPCGGGGGDDGDCQACSVGGGGAVDGTCGPVLAGGVCRLSASDCDAAEVCDGSGLTCPPDVLTSDGAPCPDGHCEAGACVPGEGSSGATTSSASDTTAGSPPTGTDAGEDDTGPAPTSSFITEAAPTGDAPTGGDQAGDGGCGCTSVASPGLAILLLVPRRRRHAAGFHDRSSM